jgi:hypothetical protein
MVASTVKAAHEIYIWERAMGSLINILEGPKEELIDVDVYALIVKKLILVASVAATRDRCWIRYGDNISMEHYGFRGMECVCPRLHRVG